MTNVNDAWKSTCKVLLGDSVGDMQDYITYLSEYIEPTCESTSALSSKKITVALPHYRKGAKFISNDEMGKYNEYLRKESLDINQIKDIDSLVDSIKEKFYYAGNQITGNSREVEDSDVCANSQHIYKSTEIFDSKYIAFSSLCRYGEYVFGSNWIGESKFLIKCHSTYRQIRCLETIKTMISSDCYYTANIEGCANCMFTFNQRNKRNLIGNLQLSQQDYLEKKTKAG
ncbi:MAG: hypothetical protein ABIH83_00120 [Candidatus Micrarchaeota archaeon]